MLNAIWLTISVVGLVAAVAGFADAVDVWFWQRNHKINGARHLLATSHVRTGSLRLVQLVAVFALGILALLPGKSPGWLITVLLFVVVVGVFLATVLDYLDRRKIVAMRED